MRWLRAWSELPDGPEIRCRTLLVVGREERPQFLKIFVVKVSGEPEIGRAEIRRERFALPDYPRFVAAKAEEHVKGALAGRDCHRPVRMKSTAEFQASPRPK